MQYLNTRKSKAIPAKSMVGEPNPYLTASPNTIFYLTKTFSSRFPKSPYKKKPHETSSPNKAKEKKLSLSLSLLKKALTFSPYKLPEYLDPYLY
jgi:hypothetical protein